MKGETVAKLKVAINGFGRIGRNFLRCWHGRKDSPLDVVVVNDSGGVKNVSLTSIFPPLPAKNKHIYSSCWFYYQIFRGPLLKVLQILC